MAITKKSLKDDMWSEVRRLRKIIKQNEEFLTDDELKQELARTKGELVGVKKELRDLKSKPPEVRYLESPFPVIADFVRAIEEMPEHERDNFAGLMQSLAGKFLLDCAGEFRVVQKLLRVNRANAFYSKLTEAGIDWKFAQSWLAQHDWKDAGIKPDAEAPPYSDIPAGVIAEIEYHREIFDDLKNQ